MLQGAVEAFDVASMPCSLPIAINILIGLVVRRELILLSSIYAAFYWTWGFNVSGLQELVHLCPVWLCGSILVELLCFFTPRETTTVAFPHSWRASAFRVVGKAWWNRLWFFLF